MSLIAQAGKPGIESGRMRFSQSDPWPSGLGYQGQSGEVIAMAKPKHKDSNVYPPGWDYKRVKAIADYYDSQKDEDVLKELETAIAAESASKGTKPSSRRKKTNRNN